MMSSAHVPYMHFDQRGTNWFGSAFFRPPYSFGDEGTRGEFETKREAFDYGIAMGERAMDRIKQGEHDGVVMFDLEHTEDFFENHNLFFVKGIGRACRRTRYGPYIQARHLGHDQLRVLAESLYIMNAECILAPLYFGHPGQGADYLANHKNRVNCDLLSEWSGVPVSYGLQAYWNEKTSEGNVAHPWDEERLKRDLAVVSALSSYHLPWLFGTN